jgi:DNA-binding PadR family transcriptional regulator
MRQLERIHFRSCARSATCCGCPRRQRLRPLTYIVRRYILAFMSKRAVPETTFLILTALAAGSQHGYGIIIDVEQISDQRVRLGPGTLYAALERLSGEGLIEVDREEIVDSRLRRYYRLTGAGVARLSEEAARLRANADAAMARLRVNPTGGVVTA